MTTYNPMSLEGKTILVTGASSGIGRGIAIECSKLGAKVICTARNEQRLAETLSMMDGEGHICIPAELTGSADVDSLVAQLPKLDGVSHNAGIGNTMLCSFAKEEEVRRVLEHNLFLPILLQTALLKKKKIAGNASIVFMNSIACSFKISIGNAFYGTSKGGLLAYAQYLAKEVAGKGVRVNSLLPGMVNTKLIKRGAITDEMHEADQKKYPLGRYGEPEDIAHLAAFLLSDASSWITGCSYVIDGGVHL